MEEVRRTRIMLKSNKNEIKTKLRGAFCVRSKVLLNISCQRAIKIKMTSVKRNKRKRVKIEGRRERKK